MNRLAVKEVKFHDVELLAIQVTETGKIYAGINKILKELGLDDRQIEYQRSKWTEDKVIAKGVQKFSYPSENGGIQESYCIDIMKLPLALAKINVTPKTQETIPDLAERLMEYQEKCAEVLASAFLSNQQQEKISFKEQVESIAVIADMLHINDASKIVMLDKLYKAYNLPTEFLPKYELNGSRELKPATELLKRYQLEMSAKHLNSLLIENGYLEERTRPSTSGKNGIKTYKALSEKGLAYGENAVSPYNQKEVQPLYYVDRFLELYSLVTGQETRFEVNVAGEQ